MSIIINDLEISKELTQQALQEIKGGWPGQVVTFKQLYERLNFSSTPTSTNIIWGYRLS